MVPFEADDEKEFTEVHHRIASRLQKPIDLNEYNAADLYTDLQEVGYEPSLDRDTTRKLVNELRELIPVPERWRDCVNPFYFERTKKAMAINLGRYAMTIRDIPTAYYAGQYGYTSPGAHPEPAEALMRQAIKLWEGWVAHIEQESQVIRLIHDVCLGKPGLFCTIHEITEIDVWKNHKHAPVKNKH